MSYQMYSDGACRGNPGPSGAGVVIFDAHGKVVHEIAQYVGEGTNNASEYKALLAGLDYCVKHKLSPVEILADSQLMIKQLTGEYRVKHEGIKPLYMEAQSLIRHLKITGYKHVLRDFNKHADRLANKGIDDHFKRS